MRRQHKKKTPTRAIGGVFKAEETQHHESATLATEAHEALIRHLGDSMVGAVSAGNRAAALRFQEQMFSAIKARPPAEIQRRQDEIDRAIAASQSTLTAAMSMRAVR